jgi:hypothetical protein
LRVIPSLRILELRVVRGPWVEELEACWRKAAAPARGRKLRVDLERVGFVDEHGRELLAKMYTSGVEVCAAGLMMPFLVEGIAAGCSQTARQTT